MIQRIQTIYLLLAGIFPAFTLLWPVAQFVGDGGKWAQMTSLAYTENGVGAIAGRHPWGLMVFALLAIVLAFVALFSYKNRKRQLRRVGFTLLCNILWYLSLGAYSLALASDQGLHLSFAISCLFPLLSIIALWLAGKGIRHDEALVRAADRIR